MNTSKGKNILIIGLGSSGLAAARFLLKRGFKVSVIDSCKNPELEVRAENLRSIGATVLLGVEKTEQLVDLVVVSPGVPPQVYAPYLERKIPVIGEFELGCREITVPMVAVTGTDGKSTVVTSIEKGLQLAGKKAVAIGNLGTPVTEWVDRQEMVDYVVLEVSSYQLETIDTFHPQVAVILNVAPDHIHRHHSMDGYLSAKARIAENQTINDALVVHKDLERHDQILKTRGRLYWYGRDLHPTKDGLSLAGNQLRWNGEGPQWSREVDFGHLYAHEIDNLLASLSVLILLGIEVDEAMKLTRDPVRLPHRTEKVGTVNGVTFVDDSKATNAHAAIAALKSVHGSVIWLVGGQSKGENLTELQQALRESTVKRVICFGQDRQIYYDALRGYGAIEQQETMRSAFDRAVESAQAGDIVLLSPAGASFDEFKSFEDRGNQFKAWVQSLEAKS